MADVYGRLWAQTQTDKARAGRAQRRAARLAEMQGLGHAVRGSLQWQLDDASEQVPGIPLTHGMHPGTAALQAAGTALSQLSIPGGYKLNYRGMSRSSGRGQHGMTDGTIVVTADLKTLSGIRVQLDIPMIVRQGRLLEPSVFFHEGYPRIIAQSTLDSILDRGTFSRPQLARSHMYSSPPSLDEERAVAAKPWQPMVRGTPFDVSPRRVAKQSAIRAAMLGVQAQQQRDTTWYDRPGPSGAPSFGEAPTHIRSPSDFLFGDMDLPEQEQHPLLGQTQEPAYPPMLSGDSDVEVPELAAPEPIVCPQCRYSYEAPYGQEFAICPRCRVKHMASCFDCGTDREHDDSLQEAARPEELSAGAHKRTTRELEVRDRGGCTYTIPKGTRLTVIRPVGVGGYLVRDSDDLEYIVPGGALGKKGGRTAQEYKWKSKRLDPSEHKDFQAGDTVPGFGGLPGKVEEIFEEVRRSEFPHRPSRIGGVFMYQDSDGDFWSRYRDGTEHVVTPTRDVFATDGQYVTEAVFRLREGASEERIRDWAREYWKGKTSSMMPEYTEYLASGATIQRTARLAEKEDEEPEDEPEDSDSGAGEEADDTEGLRLEHYSTTPGLTMLDPSYYGSGKLSRAERADMRVPVLFFYVEGTEPERLVTGGAQARYTTTLPPDVRIYDLGEDPEDMESHTRGRLVPYRGGPERIFQPGSRSDMYAAIRDAGYAGFMNSGAGPMSNVITLFSPTPVEEDLNWRSVRYARKYKMRR